MTLRKFLMLAFEKEHGQEMIKSLPDRILSINKRQLTLDQIEVIASRANMDPAEFVDLLLERRCRVCGCTQNDCSQCIEKTGSPCYWISEDLCSACAVPFKS
jgi:hypothetical protein